MTTQMFLGANSGTGFYSLYDGFAKSEGDLTYLIKAGPGGGKSSFMRRIGKEAEMRGLDVQYVLCSGDPDSLDGVYIPKMQTAFVDATSPHITEPEYFGTQACYVNLGEFCEVPRGAAPIVSLTQKYKACYKQAYRLLSAAAEVSGYLGSMFAFPEITAAAKKRAAAALDRELSSTDRKSFSFASHDCFLSGISCRGELKLEGTARELCKHIYLLDDKYGLARVYLAEVARKALERGENIIRCHDPLCPDSCEAILLPERGLGFVSSSLCKLKEPWRHIRLATPIPPTLLKEQRQSIRRCGVLRSALIAEAVSELGKAKRFHDELEEAYRPYVDFAGLESYTDAFIQKLF